MEIWIKTKKKPLEGMFCQFPLQKHEILLWIQIQFLLKREEPYLQMIKLYTYVRAHLMKPCNHGFCLFERWDNNTFLLTFTNSWQTC